MKTLKRNDSDMQTAEIKITVPAQVAERYQQATPEQRRRAEKALMATFMTQEEIAEQLGDLLDSISGKAEAAGWTDEMNEALLRGDFDD